MKKIILIIVVIIIAIGAWYVFKKPAIAPGPEISEQEKACTDFGGSVKTANCCKSASDFPNTCLIGACGCSPENSHEIKICDCGKGCWDGIKCVESSKDTSDWQVYINPKYPYTMKYPNDWTAEHDFGPNEILGRGYYEVNIFSGPSGYALVFAIVPKDDDVMPVPRTSTGAGDFVVSDEIIMVGGVEVGMEKLVFEDRVKEIFINDFEIDEFKGRAYISCFGNEDYGNLDMTEAEEVEIVKTILESFEFISENSSNLNTKGFCGTSTLGTCNSDADCMSGGCSGQVCQSKSEEPIITTCEYRDCYNAEAYGLTCGCLNKKCQWQ